MREDKGVEQQSQECATRSLKPSEKRKKEGKDEHRHVHDCSRGEKRPRNRAIEPSSHDTRSVVRCPWSVVTNSKQGFSSDLLRCGWSAARRDGRWTTDHGQSFSQSFLERSDAIAKFADGLRARVNPVVLENVNHTRSELRMMPDQFGAPDLEGAYDSPGRKGQVAHGSALV